MLFGALLRTMSQEEIAQRAPRGMCCSNRFIQEGAPKSPSWEGAEQEMDLLQILHTFLICSTEKGWGVFVPISLTHQSPASDAMKIGFTALQMKQCKIAAGLFHYVGL